MATKLRDRDWVLVADGHRAILFRQSGSRDVNLRHIDDFLPEDLEGDGPAGARPPDQSARDTDEATFAKQIALKLNWHNMQGSFDQLALIADPQTLGQIRPLLHSKVKRGVLIEIAKTMTNATVEEIEDCLR